MSEFSVKLYLEAEGEIRHFSSQAWHYEDFKNQVRELTGCDNFRLFAKDTEGDLIVVGSNWELRKVRQCLDRDYLRIHLRSTKNPSETAKNKTIHTSVSCSGCQGEVAGTRYKCLECPNYDLCEKCMGNGSHCEHDMLAARSPQSQELKKLLAQGPGTRKNTPQPTYHSFVHSIGDPRVTLFYDGKRVVLDNNDSQQILESDETIGNASKNIVEAIDSLKDQVERLAEVMGREKKEQMAVLQAKEPNKASEDHEKGENASARVDAGTVVAEKPQSDTNGQAPSPLLTAKEMSDGFDILDMRWDWVECVALRKFCVKFNGDTSRVLHFLELVSHLKNLLRS